MVIPMQEIPQEIPVVQARNDSSGVYINIGRRRVDYIFKVKDQSQFIDFEVVAGQLINRYKDSGFIRFGLIVQYLIPQKSPSQWLKDTFFKPSPQNWDEISFQFNRKSNLHGLSVNHIYHFQEVVAETNGIRSKSVLLQIDINTNQLSKIAVPANLAIAIVKDKISLARSQVLSGVLV